jgi:MFS transporter, PAT family, beta-lactamase induction signal transducer AmpG
VQGVAMKPGFWQSLLSLRMFIVLLLGFASGLPLLLTGGTLKTWLTREQVDISTVGYFGWVGMAYSLKFLWAPLVDRYQIMKLGRRRTWLVLSQLSLAITLWILSQFNPQTSLSYMAILAVVIAFFSATQDIVIDAYRREILPDNELGLGSSFYQYGYRIAMLVSGGVGVGLVGADGFWSLTWNGLYQLMAFIMLGCLIFTFFAPEPKAQADAPKTLIDAVVQPLKEFISRDQALLILFFVFSFKLGDALSGSMLSPFYVQAGYSNQEIGLIAKTVGLTSSLLGLFLGGVIIYRMGVLRSLWVFGFLQALSTAGFALITYTGPVKWALALTVVFEDISAGMGSAAFVAYIASVTDKRFTGTQYALLSSLATLGRNFFSGFAGDMVKSMGWAWFFFACALVAIPGMVMLYILQSQTQKQKSST